MTANPGTIPRFDPLDGLIAPRSIMIVGASTQAGSLGHTTVNNILAHSDFRGALYLVNPKGGAWQDHALYPDVATVPAEGIDVALLLTPAHATLQALRACATKGVRYAVVFSGGFAELGAPGAAAQADMQALAHSTGMRIVGPNCAGMTTLHPRLGLTFSTEFCNDGKTTAPARIALVTQGGGLGRSLMQGDARGVAFSRWFSIGNEADLDCSDFIQWLAHAPDTDVICAVIESIRHGPRFVTAAQAARRAGKPLIVLKIGRSEPGRKAAQSHTAALAGEDAVVDAVFAQCGVVRVEDLDELIDITALLARAGMRSLHRVCVCSSSGGAGVLCADKIGQAGLAMATLADHTVAEMGKHAPAYAALHNPVDLTTQALVDPDLARRCLTPLFADPGVDVVLYPITSNYAASTEASVRSMLAVAHNADKVFVPIWMSSRRGPAHDLLIARGMPPIYSLRNAVLALSRCTGYAHSSPACVPASTHTQTGPDTHERRDLPRTEHAVKSWLSHHGISSPRESLAVSPDAATTRARAIGWPVALKLAADNVPHKTDVGGVQLNLHTEEQVRTAFARIMENARQHRVPQDSVRGALVAEMVTDGVEMLLGIHRDPVFGPVLSVGAGGVWVEVEDDVARCLLPASRADLESALDATRTARRLAGHRSLPARDRAALLDAMQNLAAAFLMLGDAVQSLEINPLLVRNQGQGVLALDAVMEINHDQA